MRLEHLLARKKRVILDDWFARISATYPADTAEFLNRKGDPFSNPVGASTRSGLEAIFNELLEGLDPHPISDFLDPIVRIRAVQQFTPAQAVGFIFALKPVIRKAVSDEEASAQFMLELQEFEARIDDLALLGFDLYMECREAIFQLKEKEMKNRALFVLSQEAPLHGHLEESSTL